MNNITEEMYEKLKSMISTERYDHSVGVKKTAEELALMYGVDVYKASLAGLLHDCAKGFSDQELLRMSETAGIEIDEVERCSPQLLHGPVGAYIAREKFNIGDDEVLHAIMCHTTGCSNMSKLDKIIYVADYIEPSRDFPGVGDLRKKTREDLDRGVLMALDNTIKYVIERGQLIHTSTIKARNFMISGLLS